MDLKEEVRELLKEKNGILLAHNYQTLDILEAADLSGDSLELAREAEKTDARVIVFAGVHFMAETASVLNPEKTVILPDLAAGCPMADTITAEDVVRAKKEHPAASFVAYVNTTAAVKAEVDICCTSANAAEVVNSLETDEVYMLPDRNLAMYARLNTDKKIFFWDGYCPVHHALTPEEVLKVKKEHPEALFIAHPECRPEVLEIADRVFSTSGMARFVGASDNDEFIIGTEEGLMRLMALRNPEKRFYLASPSLFCPDMKKITLKKIRDRLLNMAPVVKVPEEVAERARKPIERMLELS